MTRLIVVIAFAVAFAAGLTVGRQHTLPASIAEPTTRGSHRGGGWLTSQLNLSSEQQKIMDGIWSATANRGGREMDQQRRQLRKERDEAVAGLIKLEDKPAYEAVMKRYADAGAELDREWRDRFEKAVEQTKAMLNAEQRSKYEELLAQRAADRSSSRPARP